MSIRIRVYPQAGSIGWRRNRARRMQQQFIGRSYNWQQQALQQQMFQRMAGVGGFGGYGSNFGGYGSSFGNGFGTGYNYVSQSPYGSYSSSYGFPGSAGMFGYGSVGAAYSGAYAMPGYGGYSSYATGYSPVSSAYAGAYGRGWC